MNGTQRNLIKPGIKVDIVLKFLQSELVDPGNSEAEASLIKTRSLISTEHHNLDIERLEIKDSNGVKYTLTEEFGELKLHVHGNKLEINPCCANEIIIKGYDI